MGVIKKKFFGKKHIPHQKSLTGTIIATESKFDQKNRNIMQQSRPPNQDQNLSYVGRAAAAVSQGLGITQSYHTEAANSSSPYISFKDKYDKEKGIQCHI